MDGNKERKGRIKNFASNVGNNAKDLADKTKNAVLKTVDQNDDGKLDLNDVSFVVDTIGNNVKRGKDFLKNNAAEKMRHMDLKILQPIFMDALTKEDFLMSKFIRITEREQKYIDSEVCKGAVGYYSDHKGLRYINIFRDSIDSFNLSFYPDKDNGFYYVDPSDKKHYIALDEYFSFLKVARINELQKIAQDLGAKHFRVTYKEEQTVRASSEKKKKIQLKRTPEVERINEKSTKTFSKVEIASEMDFPGHFPMKPELKYLLRDPSILNLIDMRMDETTPLLHQKYMLKMSNSSGLKKTDAVKIDAVLKNLKWTGNITFVKEVQNEDGRYLEYEIDF